MATTYSQSWLQSPCKETRNLQPPGKVGKQLKPYMYRGTGTIHEAQTLALQHWVPKLRPCSILPACLASQQNPRNTHLHTTAARSEADEASSAVLQHPQPEEPRGRQVSAF